MIDASGFQFLAKRPDVEIFTLSINVINHAMKKHSNSNIQIVLNGKTLANLFSKLPPDYHSYANVFLVSELDKLLPHRTYDYAINLEPGTKPNHRPLYKMSKDELLIFKKYLEDNLYNRFIQTSTSFTASSILFAKKPRRSLCFYVDYQKFNAITIKNYYLIPLV